MSRLVVSPEEGEELKRLYAEHQDATVHGGRVLAQHGMDSEEFFQADQRISRAWNRIREILGETNRHWMA